MGVRRANKSCGRRAGVLVYTIISLTALIGLASLAVDLGRIQTAKTELERAADAAARAAAYDVLTSTSRARVDAQSYASDNSVDGTGLDLLSTDVVFGKWNATTQTLDTTSPSPDTVQVTAVRSQARGTSIPLVIGQIIGLGHCDLTYTAIAQATPVFPNGIVALSSFVAQNNLDLGSYDSSVTTTPTSLGPNALLASNGSITASNGATVDGTMILGPTAFTSGFTLNGTTTHLSSAINTPSTPAWSPGTNPNAVPQVYSASGSTTLPGGTYWFTSLTISGTLSFSGPATIYLNGSALIGGTLTAYNGVPANLVIYQLGNNTFGDSGGNGLTLTAQIIAPGSDFVAKNNATFYGEMLFNTITFKNNADVYYDERFGGYTPPSGNTISIVK